MRMWSQALPAALPHADLDLVRLAEADLSGGGIAAAALQAAYLAADDGGEVTMEHLTPRRALGARQDRPRRRERTRARRTRGGRSA